MKMIDYRQNELTYAVSATSLLSIRIELTAQLKTFRSFLYLKGEWANVVADLGFHREERRATMYLNLVSEDNEENVSINWPRRYKSFFHAQLR